MCHNYFCLHNWFHLNKRYCGRFQGFSRAFTDKKSGYRVIYNVYPIHTNCNIYIQANKKRNVTTGRSCKRTGNDKAKKDPVGSHEEDC